MDNYEKSRDRAQKYFLNFDQQVLIERWDLDHDERQLKLSFFGRPYCICRETGAVTCCGAAAGFEQTLTVFDLLCYSDGSKAASGEFAPVNSLNGAPKGAGVETQFHRRQAELFDKDPAGFSAACLALGGTPVSMGDLGFRFTMFRDLDVIVKFYRSDEEFPPSLTLLWDRNTLQFLHYETVFYAAGFLIGQIAAAMA